MTSGPIRILLVVEDVAEQLRIERFLRGFSTSYDLHIVGSTHAAVNSLKKRRYDLALVDYRFRDGTALDLISELGTLPTIFLTDEGQEEIAALVLKRGAYDYLMRDSARNYLMLLPGTIQKVINRRRAEDALSQSEARCKDLLELVLDMYFCISEDGAILLSNRAGAYQLGYSMSEMLGMPLAKILFPGDVENVKKELLLASNTPEHSRKAQFRLVRKDGGIINVVADVRAQPERGKQIPVIRVVCRDLNPPVKAMLEQQGARASRFRATSGVGPAAPAVVPEISQDLTGSERLLIVDDAPEQRAVSARMLAKLGYRVVTAENGHAAIELLKAGGIDDNGSRKSPFDLVLLDMAMEHDFDGLETYREMLRLYPAQRCIIVSGCCENDRVKEAQSMGAGEFVSKPYSFQTLGRAVRKELLRIR